MLVESTSLHAWVFGQPNREMCISGERPCGYIPGPCYRKKVTTGNTRSAKAGIELPLSSTDRQGCLDLSTWTEGMLRPHTGFED
jgi:hypothetical protein